MEVIVQFYIHSTKYWCPRLRDDDTMNTASKEYPKVSADIICGHNLFTVSQIAGTIFIKTHDFI